MDAETRKMISGYSVEERARAAEEVLRRRTAQQITTEQRIHPVSDGNETNAPNTESLTGVESREDRLQRFLTAHSGATLADIKYSAKVHTPDFQDWRRGKLNDESTMSRRIEAVLNGTTPLEKKPGKRLDD